MGRGHRAADPRHDRLTRWLERACLGFAVFGAALPLVMATPVFSPYRGALERAVGDPSFVAGAGSATTQLVVGITGGSIAGKWLAHFAVARFAIRAGRRWALRATIAGLLAWFLIDSASSLVAGAWANVVMVNGMPLLVVLPLAWRLARSMDGDALPADDRSRAPAALAFSTSLVGIAAGLVIAFALDTPAFAPWWRGLGTAHFGGADAPRTAHTLVRFFAGPIGGSTVGQFVLLAFVARYPMRAGERWAARWALASILGWALVDSAWSLASGAAFNVLWINLPFVALTTPPLVWALMRQRRSPRAGVERA